LGCHCFIGIILVDFAVNRRHIRYRPIMMTTFAAILEGFANRHWFWRRRR